MCTLIVRPPPSLTSEYWGMINGHNKAEVAIGENTALVRAILMDTMTKFSNTQEHNNYTCLYRSSGI